MPGAGATPLSSFLIFVKENSQVCFEAIAKLALKEARELGGTVRSQARPTRDRHKCAEAVMC